MEAAAHAQVKFCLLNKKATVPVSWFKDKFDIDKFDRKKKYLVFFSPKSKETPQTLLKNVSSIPEFENAQDVKEYPRDPDGYYRATVSAAAATKPLLQKIIDGKRVSEVPPHLLKESSFDLHQKEKRASDQKDRRKRSGSASSSGSSKKGKREPSPDTKRSSSRSNLSVLKKKLIALNTAGKSVNPACKSSAVSENLSVTTKGKCSSKERSQDNLKDPLGELFVPDETRSSSGISSTSRSKGSSKEETVGSDANNCHVMTGKGDFKSNKSAVSPQTWKSAVKEDKYEEDTRRHLRPKDESPSIKAEQDDSCDTDNFGKGTENQEKESTYAISIHSNSSDDASEPEDCFVPAAKHSQLLEALKHKEAQIFQLQSANRKLSEMTEKNAQSSQDLPMDESDFSTNDSIETKAIDKESVPDNPVVCNENESIVKSEPSVSECKEEKTEGTSVESFEEAIIKTFKQANLNIADEKITELCKIAPGEKEDKPFIKLAAVLVWGSKHLREHTVSGRKNPKDKSSVPRPALDAQGLNLVRELLILRVSRENPKDTYSRRCEVAVVNRCIGEKIQSLLGSECRRIAAAALQGPQV